MKHLHLPRIYIRHFFFYVQCASTCTCTVLDKNKDCELSHSLITILLSKLLIFNHMLFPGSIRASHLLVPSWAYFRNGNLFAQTNNSYLLIRQEHTNMELRIKVSGIPVYMYVSIHFTISFPFISSLELTKEFQEEAYSVALHPSGLFLLVGFSEKLRLMNILIDDIKPYKEFMIRGCREVSQTLYSVHVHDLIVHASLDMYYQINCYYHHLMFISPVFLQ